MALQDSHAAWKKLVPYLYDWFASHSLSWPSLACRWGPLLEQGPKKNRQRLYLSEQTDGSEPNRIILVNVDVLHPRTASADHLQGFAEQVKSPHVSKPVKALIHPGEVNRLREVPQHPHVLVSHTDSPLLYVWNTDKQPDRSGVKSTSAKQQSVADLVLEGHTEDAAFALSISSRAPLAASGGKDTHVLLWDLESHSTSLAAARSSGSSSAAGAGTRLQALHRLEGHEETVEDVCWCPDSAVELASVGDDYALLLWDTRAGSAPALSVPTAHGRQDVHSVAWSPHRQELLVTGAADGTLRVWDRRKTATPAFAFHHHSQAVTVVEWCPQQAGVFSSAGEDRLLCIWDLEAKAPASEGGEGGPAAKRARSAVPPQMMFQHAGHRAPVVDFQWNPHDPWTFFSVADEAGEGGGGTLQLWRVSDMVYRPEDQVLAELEPYRDYIISGSEAALKKADALAAPPEPAGADGAAPSGTPADSGEVVERRTPLGTVLSAPLASMLLALAGAAAGLLPTASAAADAIWTYLMPLAAACYLLESDLSQLLSSAGATLVAFLIGAVGTLLGTAVAYWLVGPRLGPDGWKVAAALCASYIGGSVNFAAVSQALALAPGPALAGAMTADNCVMALYIFTIMSLPAEDHVDSNSSSGGSSQRLAAPVTAESLGLSVAAAALACTLGTQLAAAAGMPSLGLALMSVLASGLAVLGSRLAARLCSSKHSSSSSGGGGGGSGQASQAAPPAAPFAGAEALGGALMMLFFATIGAAAGSLQTLQGCGWLVLFILLQLSVHLAVCLAGGRLLRLPMQSVLIASNANVGGPATAAAMASSKGWPHMVQPAMLTGCLGYAIATFLGCAMGQWMRGWFAF